MLKLNKFPLEEIAEITKLKMEEILEIEKSQEKIK